METFSALMAICAGNSPVTGEFLAQRPVTQCFNVFFDLRLNKRLNKKNGDAGDLRRHRAHYDVAVISYNWVAPDSKVHGANMGPYMQSKELCIRI